MISTEQTTNLDKIFEALSNQHRREFIYVLGLQPYSISQLASMRKLSLQATHKHIKVLIAADLITIKKIGRTKFVTLNKESLIVLQDWLKQFHTYWGTKKESLENYVEFLNKNVKGGENK